MVKLTDVTGIGPATLKILAEHKIKTVEALAALSVDDLLKLHGFSDVRTRAVKKSAMECLRKADSPITAAKSTTTIKKTPVKKQTGAKAIIAAKTEPAQAVVDEVVKKKEKADKNKPDKGKKKNKSKDKPKDSDDIKKKKNKVKEKKKSGKKGKSKK